MMSFLFSLSSQLTICSRMQDICQVLLRLICNYFNLIAMPLTGVTFTSCGPGDRRDGWPSGSFSREAPNGIEDI